MEGRIYRVTYNCLKHVLELHLADNTIKEVFMTVQEWNDLLLKGGDIEEKLEKYLDE